MAETTLFSFGVVADVQYANSDDGHNFLKTKVRYYRGALGKLEKCVQTWNAQEQKLDFALQLGDLIDGKNSKIDYSCQALDDVMAVLNKFPQPIHHQVGNHELYNFPREKILQNELGRHTGDSENLYYHFSPAPGYRVVIIDEYEISRMGEPKDHPHTIKAEEILAMKNPNAEKNSSDDLEGVNRRFVAYNGGMGAAQLQWLKETLENANINNEKVIMAGHIPLHPDSCQPSNLLWNYQDVLDIIFEAGNVVCVFSGHDHNGGYAEVNGVHFCILPAILECEPDQNSYGIVRVTESEMQLEGFGLLESRTFKFKA